MSPDVGSALFWCDLTDVICRDACLIGRYEPQVTSVVAALLPQCATVVDVGANWGYFTLMAAKLMSGRGCVLALEPDPRMFELLQSNVRLNGFGNVELLRVAAGRSAAPQILEGFRDGTGNRGVSRIRGAGFAGESSSAFTVDSETVDALAERRDLEQVDLIKIDVEGAEDGVLAGMRTGIAEGRYRRILLEFHPRELAERGTTPDACCEGLRQAGYQGWTFDHSPTAVRRAAYVPFSSLSPASLLTRTDRVPPTDPWPHMLWAAPGVTLL
jgi:FkbM family methyltransferase